MKVALLAAVAANGVIGRDNGLPWHIPEDQRYFKRLTLGHTMVMGRRTWDSVGRPLPGRHTIVLTRRPGWSPGGPWGEKDGTVEVAPTVAAALARAAERAAGPDEEVFVVGGEEIYRQALPGADRLYITRIEQDFAGDTFFPEFDPAVWRRVACDRREPTERVPYAYRFEVWERTERADSV